MSPMSVKTVFVIGAGASHEAGLPVGDDLKDRVSDLLHLRFIPAEGQTKGDKTIVKALRELGRVNTI